MTSKIIGITHTPPFVGYIMEFTKRLYGKHCMGELALEWTEDQMIVKTLKDENDPQKYVAIIWFNLATWQCTRTTGAFNPTINEQTIQVTMYTLDEEEERRGTEVRDYYYFPTEDLETGAVNPQWRVRQDAVKIGEDIHHFLTAGQWPEQ